MALFNNMPANTQKFKDSISEGKAMMEETSTKEETQVSTPEKKKSFLDMIIVGKPDDVKNHIINNIFIPTLQKIAVDTINIIFYGKADVKQSTAKTIDKVSYTSCFSGGKTRIVAKDSAVDAPTGSTSSKQVVNGVAYEDVTADSEETLIHYIDSANEFLSQYGNLSVIELYDIAGVADGKPYTFANFGWTGITLDESNIVALDDGRYLLKMPAIKPLKGVIR